MKDYKEMSMEEIEEIRRRGGDDLNKLNQAVADYLDDLDLSGEALEVVADTPINSMAEAFGGCFTSEEVEEVVKSYCED